MNARLRRAPATLTEVRDFIATHWSQTRRETPIDHGDLLGLPRPYTVPSRVGGFQELYYWDTYYTNEGLIADGLVDQARDNVECLLHLVDRLGFVPNGNRRIYLDRSQPPHLALMVDAVWRATGDVAWLAAAEARVRVEYDWWIRTRATPTGLNRHWHHADEATLIGAAHHPRISVPVSTREDELLAGGHFIAECEAGCDFSPRFRRRCGDFLPVELNCLLHRYEILLADWAEVLGRDDVARWRICAAVRAGRIRDLLWDEARGWFVDRDWRSGRFTPVRSATALYALWCGVATPGQAARIVENLGVVERPCGVAACDAEHGPHLLQWDYPNAWAPYQYATVLGLRAYGHHPEAERVARAWLRTVASAFAATGDLWEKYNAEDGSTRTVDEYGCPAMLGWTAGTFQALEQLYRCH